MIVYQLYWVVLDIVVPVYILCQKKRKEKKRKKRKKRKDHKRKRKMIKGKLIKRKESERRKKNAKKKYFHDAGMVTLKEHQTYMNDDAYIFNMSPR